MMRRVLPSQRGFSLIELIIAIMIIGTAAVGVMSMLSFFSARSANPLWQEQATLIGEAYMSEIILKPFIDPSKKIKETCPPQEVGGRSVYDNVCDYRGPDDRLNSPNVIFPMVDVGVRDQLGDLVAGLEDYTVTVTVTWDGVTLGPDSTQTYPSLKITNNLLEEVIQVLRVEVRVQGPEKTDLTFTGYRTHYNCSFADDKDCEQLMEPL